MPVKSDRWIRTMALEHAMIEPFVDGQVRDGVISYGLTSYGYDLRVADEFKLVKYEPQVHQLTPTQAAWIAGIIDGDGTILDHHHADGAQIEPQMPQLTVALSDKRTIELLQELTGVGQVSEGQVEKKNWSAPWVWHVAKPRHVQELLLQLFHYLITKKETAYAVMNSSYLRAGMPIIDPKLINEDAFVDIQAASIDIPANSFALARSVERFRIPRNIACIVIGKSTYARCGIIVNVTPLEPEWSGYVTIEISNTTPLPARIYANEGIGQVVFLEGDEPCAVSYADKKGKYQGQQGIVLPRIDRNDAGKG